MTTDVLRKASEQIRYDSNNKYARGHIPYREAWFLLATADWLDLMTQPGRGDDPDEWEAALAVARAYLGEQA
jgi:hypothetical protein